MACLSCPSVEVVEHQTENRKTPTFYNWSDCNIDGFLHVCIPWVWGFLRTKPLTAESGVPVGCSTWGAASAPRGSRSGGRWPCLALPPAPSGTAPGPGALGSAAVGRLDSSPAPRPRPPLPAPWQLPAPLSRRPRLGRSRRQWASGPTPRNLPPRGIRRPARSRSPRPALDSNSRRLGPARRPSAPLPESRAARIWRRTNSSCRPSAAASSFPPRGRGAPGLR